MNKETIDFDRNAAITGNEYDNIAPLALPGYEAMHQMALACLQANLSPEANILVVGAGTGMELIKFALGNPKWQILGVDPSEKMLAIAQDKIQQHDLSEQIKLFQGYTDNLPETSIYDAATSILVMHFIPDDGGKLAFLQSIAQRMKSSSTFILVDAFGEKGTDNFQQIVAVIKKFWQQTGVPEAKQIELLETLEQGVYPISETRVLELLEQAGFSKVIRFYTGLWIGGWMALK
ncbi:class I SAM-dependent methyltransferase [Plectonema cf. radiosum LEGE 06105]|uniref:Class I SAM-dependent methyltransferase n=1 Tax=Plectonema cf. radiosum LEGE 06105 TaxID=945769 RepID=A0A8J7K493_9CYAN|nr:class I SAM-dependent methyltransferase [Plectonema radiosum]MBE9216751.1 class I SAM-dependent methyltransferase [Plectonema cf. radiosum LEGE 06105]